MYPKVLSYSIQNPYILDPMKQEVIKGLKRRLLYNIFINRLYFLFQFVQRSEIFDLRNISES